MANESFKKTILLKLLIVFQQLEYTFYTSNYFSGSLTNVPSVENVLIDSGLSFSKSLK